MELVIQAHCIEIGRTSGSVVAVADAFRRRVEGSQGQGHQLQRPLCPTSCRSLQADPITHRSRSRSCNPQDVHRSSCTGNSFPFYCQTTLSGRCGQMVVLLEKHRFLVFLITLILIFYVRSSACIKLVVVELMCRIPNIQPLPSLRCLAHIVL